MRSFVTKHANRPDFAMRPELNSSGISSVLLPALLVALLLALLAATVASGHPQAAPHAKPTPKPGLLAGTGVVRLGQAYASAGRYDRYSYVVVSQGDARAAARLPGTSLVYMSGTSIPPTWFTGVPFERAASRGWLLKDASGHYIVSQQYGNYIADVGNPDYQRAFATGVLSFLARAKVDGVFIDDVVASYNALTGSAVPTAYPNQESWEAAMTSFIYYVGPILKRHGYYVLVNAGKFVPGNPGSDTAALTAEFWRRLAPCVNGLMSEYWLQNPLDPTLMRVIGTQWFQNWDGWQGLVSVAQRGGADFFGLTFGSGDNQQAMRFGRGSFLLDWNGRGGAFMYSINDRPDPYAPTWVTQFGLPLRPKFQRAPGVWQRRYQRGLIVVNANTAPVTLRVNGSMQTVAAGDALFSAFPA